MKTLVVYGMFRRIDDKHTGEYSDFSESYNVEDSFDYEDVYYVLRDRGIVDVARRESGEKLSFMIGIDKEKTGSGPVLNRVAFMKKFKNDIKKIEWRIPKRNLPKGDDKE